ncbi:MAG: hypothetical protein WCX64_05160 [Candidatus Micrarchaeia archaeon]
MRLSFSFLLFALLCAPALAAVPSCVLHIRVDSPSDGFIAPIVPDGTTNVHVVINVTNASSNSPVSAQAKLILDNGTQLDIPSSSGNQSVSFADYREGTHTFSIYANRTGCISDSVTQYYYYRKGTIRSAPDFNPLLVPFVAVAMLLVARTNAKKKSKGKK